MNREADLIERDADDTRGWRRLARLVFRPFCRKLDHEHLATFSDAELADIGVRRWEIDHALRTGQLPK